MGCGAPVVLWCAFVKCSTRHPNSSWQCCKWQRGKMQFIYPTSTWAPANSKVEGTYLVQSVACAWLHSIREKKKLLLQLGFFTRGAVAAQFSAWSTWSENQNHNIKRGTAVGFFQWDLEVHLRKMEQEKNCILLTNFSLVDRKPENRMRLEDTKMSWCKVTGLSMAFSILDPNGMFK